MKHGLGLVIGKFYPPHHGHKLLIDTATEQSDRTVVIVCAKPTDTIPGELRGEWLREMHSEAKVMVIDDRYDENNSKVWAENTIRWLGHAPDAVFTSEDYGDRYAELMGSKHVSVDRSRSRVSISGTAVRGDPFANWDFIEPPVRGWFTKRICVLGAESTGTTTLAKALADKLQTNWVEEYGREYSELKVARNDPNWRSDEFTLIAAEQSRRENAAARSANRVLICDTNAFATVLWHRRYMGTYSPDVERIAAAGPCDLYLLTGDEIPFVQDGLRDGEHIRHEMHTWFEQALARQPVPWKLLRGSHDERLREALGLIQELFKDSAWRPKFQSDENQQGRHTHQSNQRPRKANRRCA
ncbi:MAG: AAA family ATPase [Verrucomicrobiota bacterium]